MMEHNGGNDSVAQSSPIQCHAGCGFYGSASFDGMCSKCYKDSVKRRQQNPAAVPLAGRTSPVVSVSSYGNNLVVSGGSTPAASSSTSCASATRHSVETASPTVTVATASSSSTSSTSDKTSSSDSEKSSEATANVEAAAEGAVASAGKDKEGEKDGKKPKKNRCHVCKKKVGLTGFECRCSGLFCSIHRYSDKHDCTFNYKELAQVQIRKNNPVIVGAKIQKI